MSSGSASLLTDAQQQLWHRLAAFEIGDTDVGLTCTDRLARENGWTDAFAARVVEEYKRFVFLAMEAGHPVTPSEEVDQAWHLHLVYTRSYWDELCGTVLRRPLHHGPTKGGSAEGDKFKDWYQRTLDSYRRLFGTEPPPDVWPAPVDRFRYADRFRRVNTADHVIVSKRQLRQRVVSPVGLLLAAIVATGCAAAVSAPARQLLAQSDGSTDIGGIVFVVALVAIVGLVIARSSSGKGGGSGCATGDSGCGGGGCGGCGGCGG